MKSKKPRHLKAVDSWDPANDPHVIAALRTIVRAIMQHPPRGMDKPPKKRRARYFRGTKALDAKLAARNASPIYRKAKKNKIRFERAGKVRGKKT